MKRKERSVGPLARLGAGQGRPAFRAFTRVRGRPKTGQGGEVSGYEASHFFDQLLSLKGDPLCIVFVSLD
jgi:hypothetical protein